MAFFDNRGDRIWQQFLVSSQPILYFLEPWQVHLYKLGELRLKQDKMRNQFQMSRDWFDVALESKENELKKARENFYVLKKKM